MVLAAVGIVGSPFSFADGNSGRYLPNVYRAIDPSLFQGDQVAEAFTRFKSVFYSGLGLALRVLHVPALSVEPVLYGMLVVSKVGAVMLLWTLIRALEQELTAFVLIAAWASHEKAAAVGGDSMFASSMTHATVAVLMGIGALVFLLRGRTLAFWITLACALFVHSLIALHLALIAGAVLVVRERDFSASNVVGTGAFGLALLAYIVWMTPPSFDQEEAHLFLQAKGSIAHIAPQTQGWLSWLTMAGRVMLALLVCRRFLRPHSGPGKLSAFMVAGSVIAPAIGMAATMTGSLSLAQIQPMRMFEWVNLFAFVLIACGVPKAWEQQRPLGLILLTVIALNILGSLWGLAWIGLAIACLVLRSVPARLLWSALGALTIAALGIAIAGSTSAESLSDPVPVVLLLLVGALTWFGSSAPQQRSAVVGIALVVALAGRTVYVHQYVAERTDADYEAACHWIARNTPAGATFITAVTSRNTGNFRARALRTSVNESQSALYWVAPRVARENARISQEVQSASTGDRWNLDALSSEAASLGAEYILLQGDPVPEGTLFQQGEYRVVKVLQR